MISGNRGYQILELKETPFCNREGRFFVMKRAFLQFDKTPPLFANNSFHSPLHYFPSVSDRWFREGVRLLLTSSHQVFLPLGEVRWGYSIRRGDGGEAFLHLQTIVFTPLSIRRGVGGEAVVNSQCSPSSIITKC